MNPPRPHASSAYMHFAKLHSGAPYNLATSGVTSYPLSELNVRIEDLEINGPTIYGYPPLLEAIAHLKGVASECVVEATGTSLANHLAMSALFAPGDEVLIEEPTYELILNAALYLGARVRRFPRHAAQNFALDPSEVAKHLTPHTRLIVLCNLHNPSGTLATEQQLRAVGDLAASVGARVLVDEVYLECLHHPPVATALHLGPQFVVTSSLTKAYGLSGLRCGWILAEPALAQQMWQLNDLFAASPVHVAELLSVTAIAQLDRIGRRADAIIEANRAALTGILANHPALDLTIPAIGTTAFPRLLQGDVDGFHDFLREGYQTSIVPGRFFECPDRFRIGLTADPTMTREGLLRLSAALDAWHARSPAS
jgi:aspartate/methionine/tyrosine aminotransferase